MTRPDPEQRDAQRVVDGLAELFDSVAPHDRAAAEEELRDAGLDPDAVGTRFARLARQDAPSSPHPVALPAASSAAGKRRVLYGALAAMLIGGFAWLLSGQTSFRSVRQTPELPSASQKDPFSMARPQSIPSAPEVARSRQESPPDAAPGTGNAAAPPANMVARGQTGDWSAPLPTPDTLADEPLPVAGMAGKDWILHDRSWPSALGLLPSTVLQRVKSGDYWFHIVKLDPVAFKRNYSEPFWQASEKNRGRFDLDPETCGLREIATGVVPEFYFGYPFPSITTDDPLNGCRVAWNIEAASAMGESQSAHLALDTLERQGDRTHTTLSVRTLAYLGRSGGPIDNPKRLRAAALAGRVDGDGLTSLVQRSNDWHVEDNVWFYLPEMRRVRRLPVSALTVPIAGSEVRPNDLNCAGEKIEAGRWRLTGSQDIFAPLVSTGPLPQVPTASPSRFEVGLPYLFAAYERPGAQGVPWLVVDHLVLAKRPVWVVEVEPLNAGSNYERAVLYVDRELYRVYWKLTYGLDGNMASNTMCAYHFSQSGDRNFSAVTPSLVVGVNDQANRATLAGRYTTEVIERGAPDDFFSLSTLTRRPD
jgi:hypothetical protein